MRRSDDEIPTDLEFENNWKKWMSRWYNEAVIGLQQSSRFIVLWRRAVHYFLFLFKKVWKKK